MKTWIRHLAVLSALSAACTNDGAIPSKEDARGAADTGVDYCERYSWYDDLECDDFCKLPDPDCGGMAATCFAEPTDATASAACCSFAPYAYCGAARSVPSVDGEGPSVCIGVRGNGGRITGHFSSIARFYEEYGLVDGVSGGSSASVTTFVVDSIQQNPAVRAATTSESKGVVAAFLMKSLYGYLAALAQSDEATSIGALVALKQRIDEMGIPALLESNPTAGVDALITLLESDVLRALINPEAIALLRTSSDPARHARDLLEGTQKAVSFMADDASIFVRPGLISFAAFTDQLSVLASFYAGYAPVDMTEMNGLLRDCAAATKGMTWEQASAFVRPGGQTCGASVTSMVTRYRAAVAAAAPGTLRSRGDEYVGSTLPVLVTTAVLRGQHGIDVFEDARAAYQSFQPLQWDTTFADVGFAYMGAGPDLARVEANMGNYTDFKTARFVAVSGLRWREAVMLSAAEPGLARGLPVPGTPYISVGGWPDLFPSLALKNMGCEKTVYITSRGNAGGLNQQVSAILGITEAEALSYFDPVMPSSFRLSLQEFDGRWCTDWNGTDQNDLGAMFNTGYNATLETSDTYLSEGNSRVSANVATPGCTPGLALMSMP